MCGRDACKEEKAHWVAQLPPNTGFPGTRRRQSFLQPCLLKMWRAGCLMLHSLELEVHEESVLVGRQHSYGFSSNCFLSPACVHTLYLLLSGHTRAQVFPLGEDQASPGSREDAKLTQEGPYNPKDPTRPPEMASREATGADFRVR